MLNAREKAFAVSATGHALLLLCVFQVSQWRPVQRGYPRTISAVLVPKGPAGSGQAPSKLPAGAAPAAPVIKKEEPAPKTSPPEKVAKDRRDKKTSAVPVNSATAKKKKDEAPRPQSSAASPPVSANATAGKSGGGKLGVGSGTGGVARVDGPAFPFPHYLALLQYRIENQWQPAYLGEGQFSATVHFVVAKNGGIISVELEQSSGNFTFDQAALRAVHNANPLPPLPAGTGLETLGVHFDFVANW